MKSEIRGTPPSQASFNRGRINARNDNLLQRIQERNGARQATLVLRRAREPVKPQLARQVEAVRFEETSKVRNRAGAVSAAVAAGLLVLLTPNLGTAEPAKAPAAGQVEADNPFGFVKGKTRVKEIGKLLGAKGIGELEWVLDEDKTHSVTALLVADGVKVLYVFMEGTYYGVWRDFSEVQGLDISKARNWTITISKFGRFFVTAENLTSDGNPVIFLTYYDSNTERDVNQTIDLTNILKREGSMKNPRLIRKGPIVLLHADKEDGMPWDYVYGFRGDNGVGLGAKPAKTELASLVP